MESDVIGANSRTNHRREFKVSQGVSLAGMSFSAVDRKEAEAALAKLTSNKELVAELAARTIELPGIGLAVRLPFFTYGTFSSVVMAYHQWPEFSEHGYAIGEAVRICGDENRNPLVELFSRQHEAESWAACDNAAELARASRLRQHNELVGGWGRIGALSRTFLRAAARLNGAERSVCIELAAAAVEESQARTSDGLPGFDEKINEMIRQLGRVRQ